MAHRYPGSWLICLAALLVANGVTPTESRAVAATNQPVPAVRKFLFKYEVVLRDLGHGDVAKVWLPVPTSDADQVVAIRDMQMPGVSRIDREPKYGNRILYVEARSTDSRPVKLWITYAVTRLEVGPSGDVVDAVQRNSFLQPDVMVPLGGKPMTLLAGSTRPKDDVRLARILYDLVDAHLQYRKDKPGWGRGDATWACDSGFGNCTDFHSLFISLARSNHLPAKFEMGFLLPENLASGEIAGYHCWARFAPEGHGWVPVNISEANQHPALKDYYFGHLSPNRVCFSVGRDLELVPRQSGPPLNFFVYPYVEVGGKAYPNDKVTRTFKFANEGEELR